MLEKKILKWNHADRKVYDYFNKTFWRGVDTYGREKMAGDIATLQRKQKEAENLCIDSYQPFKKKPWILGAKLRKKPTLYCKHLAWSETVYGEHLREKMYNTIPGLQKPSEEEEKQRQKLFDEVAHGALQND